jgi:hypothetical protein
MSESQLLLNKQKNPVWLLSFENQTGFFGVSETRYA